MSIAKHLQSHGVDVSGRQASASSSQRPRPARSMMPRLPRSAMVLGVTPNSRARFAVVISWSVIGVSLSAPERKQERRPAHMAKVGALVLY